MINATLSIRVEAASAKDLRNKVTKAIEEILDGKLETQFLQNYGIRIDMTVVNRKEPKNSKKIR